MIGALIFAVLVLLTGVGLAATGNVADPFDFLSTFSLIQRANERYVELSSFSTRHVHADSPRSDPPAEDQNDIDWPGLMALVFDIWVLCAVTTCYILIQQTAGLLISGVRARAKKTG